jgi:FkbM family methyltransferase
MLIPFSECCQILKNYNKKPRGILHIGAHHCEELNSYKENGVNQQNIYWIDAIKEKVDLMRSRGVPNVFCAALDNNEQVVNFHITNNGESSSLLDFGTHQQSYPHIHVVESREVTTQTLKSFIETNRLQMEGCNFWNLDIQGKELDVLRSGEEYLVYADALYCEVNTEEVYKGCGVLSDLDAFLQEKGFHRVKINMTDRGWGDALYVRV